VVDRIKLSATRPQVTKRRNSIEATKSLMNKVSGDNGFELAFARFLEAASDVQAFYKNTEATGFTVEYQSAGGGIVRDYRPDFVARATDGTIWIVETKGREDLDDPRKWERLKLWCEDATRQDAPKRYRPMFVREEAWGSLLNPVRTLADAEAAFDTDRAIKN
jgi:type III restriction enzyme